MEVVVPIAENALVEASKSFFTELGFALVSIKPADDPRDALLQGHGCRLRLLKGSLAPPPRLRLTCEAAGGPPRELTAPNGTVVEVVADLEPPLPLPALAEAMHISRTGGRQVEGRAGMVYRDLIPTRLGGRFVASHIQIPEPGPVPDMVHHHACRFQLIFCVSGSVRLVYEDQGPPFWLQAGDCVLQPPGIRHRVLESSGGLQVLEIGSPAEHLTEQDLELSLPTAVVRADREWAQAYDGQPQRFVRHQAAASVWTPHPSLCGWDCADTGIAQATQGLGSCLVARCGQPGGKAAMLQHDGELVFRFVVRGECTVRLDRGDEGATSERLGPGDSVVVPAGVGMAISGTECELIEVMLPADVRFTEVT